LTISAIVYSSPINLPCAGPSNASSARARASGAAAEKAVSKQFSSKRTVLITPTMDGMPFPRRDQMHSRIWKIDTFGMLVVAPAVSVAAFAQMETKPASHQASDKEKIADALRAGPAFITKDVVIADWPANPKDLNTEYRVLRAGKSDWTCLPGIPRWLKTAWPTYPPTSIRLA
jgi:hypothetical protein